MKLSMSMIAQELPYLTLEKGSGHLRFSRCEVLCAGGVLEPDVLYLTRAGHIPAGLQAPEGGGAVCVGRVSLSMLPGLEVLTVDEDVDVISLVNAVNAIFHRYGALELKLHEAVNGRQALQAVIALAAPLFSGNELLVLSPDFRVLAQSGPELELLAVSGMAQPTDGALPDEAAAYLKNDRSFTQSRLERRPVLWEPAVFACPLISMNVFYQGEPACRVILAGSRRPFRDHDMELLGFAAGFVQQIYDCAAPGPALLPQNRLTDLLGVLIRGQKVDLYALSEELHRRGWDRHGSYVCLCIQPDTRSVQNKSLPYSCNLLNSRWPEVCAFACEEKIACLVELSAYGGRAEAFFAARVEQFRDLCFRVGVSDAFSDLLELHPSYRQSEIALRVGSRRDGQKWRYRFSDYSLDYIFQRLTGELDASHVASWRLRLLIDHDRQNKTEYCRTLYCYICCGMNAMKSARELYIHRTTMVYRLNRIRELTGLDLEDARELLYIHLSIVLLWDEMKNLNVI